MFVKKKPCKAHTSIYYAYQHDKDIDDNIDNDYDDGQKTVASDGKTLTFTDSLQRQNSWYMNDERITYHPEERVIKWYENIMYIKQSSCNSIFITLVSILENVSC